MHCQHISYFMTSFWDSKIPGYSCNDETHQGWLTATRSDTKPNIGSNIESDFRHRQFWWVGEILSITRWVRCDHNMPVKCCCIRSTIHACFTVHKLSAMFEGFLAHVNTFWLNNTALLEDFCFHTCGLPVGSPLIIGDKYEHSLTLYGLPLICRAWECELTPIGERCHTLHVVWWMSLPSRTPHSWLYSLNFIFLFFWGLYEQFGLLEIFLYSLHLITWWCLYD